MKICEIANLKDREECVIIGTVVKLQELRPSVLKQLASDVSYFNN